jgi:aarF domain-containing kinase
LAQWAGSRADLFPAQLCQRLGDLHSHGKPHSFAHTKRVIEKVFQRNFDDVFEEFEETPIGTGAIAQVSTSISPLSFTYTLQVYRATLKQDLIPPSHLTPKRSPPTPIGPVIRQDPTPSVPSNAVAIKVLHPRVKKMISRDLSIMNFFAKTLSLLPGMQWLSLPEEVEVFGKLMSMQLDLRNEADNLFVFEKNFAPRKVPVMFPRPLKNWSTEDILVEEYMHALPLESVMKNGGGPFDKQLATVGLDAFLASSFHFLHIISAIH